MRKIPSKCRICGRLLPLAKKSRVVTPVLGFHTSLGWIRRTGSTLPRFGSNETTLSASASHTARAGVTTNPARTARASGSRAVDAGDIDGPTRVAVDEAIIGHGNPHGVVARLVTGIGRFGGARVCNGATAPSPPERKAQSAGFSSVLRISSTMCSRPHRSDNAC